MIPLGSFDAQPNAADWYGSIEVIDDDTGTAWDLTDYLIEMEVRDADGYRRLSGTSTDGTITLAGDGFEFTFAASRMRDLVAGSYVVNIRLTDSETGFVSEPVIASLPVLEGGFR